MALAAPAQLVLPTWDETIVPSLRKRLESESRILAKRMSVASITSADDSPRSTTPSKSPHFPREYRTTPVDPRKSSAIPRPSLQHPKGTPDGYDESPANGYSRPNGASSPHPPPMRARTYSQPSIFDNPQLNGHPNGNVSSTLDPRSASPRTFDVNIRPTRIPVPMRNRTTSSSSHAHSLAPRAESRNGVIPGSHQSPNPEVPQDLWVVKEVDQTPTPSIPQQASTSLMNEPAPFPTAAMPTRSRGHEPAVQQPRASTDSEERPFEHWYRGDVHRNGGVGELRVAKHVEMLQIANFGHTIQSSARAHTREHPPGFSEYGRRRKRAESVGAGTRDSLLLDDERTQDVDMVFDERPLTDIEAEADIDTETFYDAYVGTDDTMHSGFNTSKPELSLDSAADVRSGTPVGVHSPIEDTTLARVPMARTISEPLRSESPSAGLVRSSAESTMPTRHPSTSRERTASRTTSPVSQTSDQSQTKRRAKSPATSSPTSTPKKPKTKAKTPPPASRQKEDPRQSIAVYPTPEGDMVNAIPTWTQPVQKSGTWDDVVLPVVARKKGLDGQYEQADGSPRPKPPEPTVIKPAPGTFGFDYSKYKSPREEAIPMDEFGQVREQPQSIREEEEPMRHDSSPGPIPRLSIQEPRELPQANPRSNVASGGAPPFSQYLHAEVPTISITRPSDDTEQAIKDDEDSGAGACCKCVIM